MNIIEFRNKKYWEKFVELKKLTKEFEANQKAKKKFFALRNAGKEKSFEYMNLKWKIIW